jgi:flavin-dependent dehydrogenase
VFHLNEHALDRADTLKSTLVGSLAERSIDALSVQIKAHSIRPVSLGSRASVTGAILVGESVGVDPVTGEGIAHGLGYGSLAADVLDDALRTGDVRFADWHRRIERSFVGRHLRDACRLAPLVYGRHAAKIARFLARSPDAMAMGARWYLGERITRAEKLSMAAGFAMAWLRGRLD